MLTKSYNNFWQRIHKSAKTKGFLLRVMFELTYRCNFKCGHCYVPFGYRKLKELKTREVFSILDQLKEMGCFYLGFTGGEPFLREDIFDISWYAKKIGFQIIFYTNGSLIDEARADELIRLNPNKVDITIPAMSKAAFERISKVGGSHDKVFQAIELLYKNGINLGFKTCVLKENQDEIKDIQKFAKTLGAWHRLDSMLLPRLDGSKEPYRYRGRLKDKLVTGLPIRLRKRAGKLQVRNEKANNYNSEYCAESILDTRLSKAVLFKCGTGRIQAAITPLGELKLCLMIDFPKFKILDTSLKDAWCRLKRLASNIKPDKNYQCHKCQLQPYCKWCPARGWLYNRSFTSCEPENYRKAELTKQLLNC